VIKFVSDLQQVGGFLHNITEILLKAALKPLKQGHLYYRDILSLQKEWHYKRRDYCFKNVMLIYYTFRSDYIFITNMQ
jgi:hypothetical protein